MALARSSTEGTISTLRLYSTCSVLDGSGGTLTDDSRVLAWAEATAYNYDNQGADAVTYPDGTAIPLVGIDGSVVAAGALLVEGTFGITYGNEEFVLNAVDELVGSGTLLVYEGANATGLATVSAFAQYAENAGYTVEASSDLAADLPGADGVIVASPTDRIPSSDVSALATAESNGKGIFLFNGSDFRGNQATQRFNAALSSLAADLSFNDDQVVDETNNDGEPFVPLTGEFNETDYPAYFASRPGIDEATTLDPTRTYTVEVESITDGDTFDTTLPSGFPATVRVVGVDTPETVAAADAERPVEWEGLADGVALTEVVYDSGSSLLDADGDPLWDDSLVAVRAEPTATTTDADGNGDAVSYPDALAPPLVAVDGRVAALGAPFVDDDTLGDPARFDNEELYLNLWDALLGGSGTVRWDESHGQSYDRASASRVVSYAEANGYAVEAGTSIPADTSSVDGLVVTSPATAFSGSELSALSSFVADGGVVVLHSQSDLDDGDGTAALNAIAAELDVGVRFNDDQVIDPTDNAGREVRPTTGRFNGDGIDAFGDRPGLDDDLTLEAVDSDPVDEVVFDSAAPLLDGSGQPGVQTELVAVRAEPTATVEDSDGDGDAVTGYGEPLPLVAIDGRVAALGAPFVDDDVLSENGDLDNEELYLNLWDALLGGTGTVRWDEGHDQFYDRASASRFVSYAEANGYAVEAGTSIPADTSSVDGLVVTSPSTAFSGSELSALSSFVADGGVVLLHTQSDFNDFDATDNLDAIAAALDVGVRFNDAQVIDGTNNAGADFQPTTTDVDAAGFPALVEPRAGVDDQGRSFYGETYPYLSYHAALASDWAIEELDGETVDISFDPRTAQFNGGVKDPFGRLLAYVHYDADGSGSRDDFYNERLVEAGYARVYGSGFSRHDELWAAERDARASGRGVWVGSNPAVSTRIRDGPVREVFVPYAEAVASGVGTDRLAGRVPVRAPDGTPLVAVDADARLVVVGGLLIDETYERAEGFPVDTAGYGNFTLVSNLLDAVGDAPRGGDVLIDGGHGQFNPDYALSSEDAAYYQRFLEGFDVGFEQVNSLTDDRFERASAIVLTAPAVDYDAGELAALRSFTADGGVVALLGDARAPAAARDRLDGVAARLGSDLRLSGRAVTDGTNNLDGNPSLVVTSSFERTSDTLRPFVPYAARQRVGPYGAPTDPDGDGAFEDVDGDGSTTFNDVVTLFEEFDGPAVRGRGTDFDFNGNGRVDFTDVIRLFESL
jgi:endonuclease YncB( thermonuclease family)